MPTHSWVSTVYELSMGVAFSTLCSVFIWLLRNNEAGHKKHLRLAIAFVSLCSAAHFAAAWSVVVGPTIVADIAYLSAALFVTCFTIYTVSAKGHLMVTLVRSQLRQRALADHPADLEQMRSYNEYMAETNLTESEELVNRYAARGV